MEAWADQYALQYGLDPGMVRNQIQRESGWRPGATGAAGEIGLMQVMPSTAKDMGYDRPEDLYDPETAIRAGTAYLSKMKAMVGGDTEKALAAYNWGIGNVLNRGMDAMPQMTRDYIREVMGEGGRGGAPIAIAIAVAEAEGTLVAPGGVARFIF